MRFLVDECTGPTAARWLAEQGHDVFCAHTQAQGATDDELMALAIEQERILVTNDKGFAGMAYRSHREMVGVVLLRLADERPVSKVNALRRLLDSYGDLLPGAFLVVTDRQVRIARA